MRVTRLKVETSHMSSMCRPSDMAGIQSRSPPRNKGSGRLQAGIQCRTYFAGLRALIPLSFLRYPGYEVRLRWIQKEWNGNSRHCSMFVARHPGLRLSASHFLSSLARSSALSLWYLANYAFSSYSVTRLTLWLFCLSTPLGSSPSSPRPPWLGLAHVSLAVEALRAEDPLGLLRKLLLPIAAPVVAIVQPQPILCNLGISWTLVALALTLHLYQLSVQQFSPSTARRTSLASMPTSRSYSWRKTQLTVTISVAKESNRMTSHNLCRLWQARKMKRLPASLSLGRRPRPRKTTPNGRTSEIRAGERSSKRYRRRRYRRNCSNSAQLNLLLLRSGLASAFGSQFRFCYMFVHVLVSVPLRGNVGGYMQPWGGLTSLKFLFLFDHGTPAWDVRNSLKNLLGLVTIGTPERDVSDSFAPLRR